MGGGFRRSAALAVEQLAAFRQPLHVAADLYRAAADPVAARHRVGQRQAFQQRADHPDREAVAGAHGVHHGRHRHAGDQPFAVGIAIVGAARAELDRHRVDAHVQVERGDIRGFLPAAEQAAFLQARQDPVGMRGEGVDLGDHAALAGPQRGPQVGIEGQAGAPAAHAPHQFVGQLAGTRRECRRNAGGVQVAGAEHFFADMGEAQPAGRRAAAEVLDPRVGTIDLAGLHLEPGGRLRVDLDEAAVEALAGQAVEYEAAERVVADPAQPGHREAEAGEADGDVAVGAGDALAELLDPVQFAGLFGDEHGHGLAEAEDLEVSHAGVPPGAGRGGRGRRCAGG